MVGSWRYTTATVLGVLGTIAVASIWIVILAPYQWQLHFPRGARGATVTLIFAIVGSLVAAIVGRRACFILTAISVFTFVYMWFLPAPLWY